MQKKHQEPKIDVTIATEDGKAHHITTATLLKVMDRGERYLEAAVTWRREFDKHLAPLCAGPDEEKYDGEHARRFKRIIDRFQLPAEIWFPTEAFSKGDREEVSTMLCEWLNGNLDDFEDFYSGLDADKDVDHTYLLFGVPVSELSVEAQQTLREVGERFGCWRIGGQSLVPAN